jgi:hypothetical protein
MSTKKSRYRVKLATKDYGTYFGYSETKKAAQKRAARARKSGRYKSVRIIKA